VKVVMIRRGNMRKDVCAYVCVSAAGSVKGGCAA